MSNFPIIPTTPPPLDINGSDEEEEEEEPEFRTFNDISPEEEKDIDFVIPDFIDTELEVQTEGQTSTDFNDKNTLEDKHNEDFENKSIEEKDINFCDNRLETKISEKETQIVTTNEELNENTINPNENNLDSNQNHSNIVLNDNITENSLNIEEDMAEEEEFSDFNGVNTDENDFDFADFTAYQSAESQECKEVLKQNEDSFNENDSISFYKSEISFGDFKDNFQTNFDAINDSQNIDNNFNDNESDDDFADFASAQPVLNTDFQSVSSFKSNIGEQIESEEKDDGFADFASFQDTVDNSYQLTDSSALHLNNISLEESDKFTQIFAQVFPNIEPIDSVENSPNISRDLFNNADQNSKNLWKELQDLESAPSLKLKWSTSHSFQLLLTALNIDPRNILRNPSVPMFASGLGYVLEPTKHKFNGDFSDEIESENTNGLTLSSIPPVQFDWISSGLTNPLDANQKSMVAFDLDFFVTNDDVKNTTKQTGISNFEEELLNDKNDNNLESNSHVLDKNKNNLMQKILSSVGNTSSISMPQSNGSQVLSAEALQVLDELPNLSFLRAKVLMFPINIKTNP